MNTNAVTMDELVDEAFRRGYLHSIKLIEGGIKSGLPASVVLDIVLDSIEEVK